MKNRIYLVFSAIGFLITAAYYIRSVASATNSTAGIGYLFVPVAGMVGAGIGFTCVFIASAFNDVFLNPKEGSASRAILALGILLMAATGFVVWKIETTALGAAKGSDSVELQRIYNRHFFLRRREIHEALAANSATPLPLLEILSGGAQSHLVSLVGANPSTTTGLLEKIVAGPRTYDRLAGAATNPKLSRSAQERLSTVTAADFPGKTDYQLYQVYVLAALARQKNLPEVIFERLAAWENPEYFLVTAILNTPRATCAQIGRFLNTENEILQNTADREFIKRNCRR